VSFEWRKLEAEGGEAKYKIQNTIQKMQQQKFQSVLPGGEAGKR
jgi:hypothetical protein